MELSRRCRRLARAKCGAGARSCADRKSTSRYRGHQKNARSLQRSRGGGRFCLKNQTGALPHDSRLPRPVQPAGLPEGGSQFQRGFPADREARAAAPRKKPRLPRCSRNRAIQVKASGATEPRPDTTGPLAADATIGRLHQADARTERGNAPPGAPKTPAPLDPAPSKKPLINSAISDSTGVNPGQGKGKGT